MDKATFKQEIADYKRNGGKFSFRFGDVVLPVVYDDTADIIAVKMDDTVISSHIDYNKHMDDNLDVLMNDLLDKHPELTD